METSNQYIGAVVLLAISVFKIFGIEIPSDALNGFITSVIALYIAYKRYKKGDINILGKKV